MLYRQYRPKQFSELVALDPIITLLANQIINNNIAHAYLFSGPKGIGKTTTARLFAKSLFCESRLDNAEPCGVCVACDSVNLGKALDLIEIDAASNRGIDDIRELKEKVNLSPAQFAYKVYIIDEVHMLTKEAFNALLKTLEEPPSHAVFILCTTEAHRVPVTIISRCVRCDFPKAARGDIVKKLKYICEKEEREVSEEVLNIIAANSSGGFRDAETMLMSYFASGIIPESGSTELQNSLFLSLLNKNSTQAIAAIDEMLRFGMTPEYIITGLVSLVANAFRFRFSPNTSEVEEVSAEVAEGIRILPEEVFLEMSTKIVRMAADSLYYGSGILPVYIMVAQVCRGENSSETLVTETAPENISKPVTPSEIPQDIILEDTVKTVEPVGDSLDAPDLEWSKFVQEVSKIQPPLGAILRGCKMVSQDKKNNRVVIQAFYPFHYERLSQTTTIVVLNDIVSRILSHDYSLEIGLNRESNGDDRSWSAVKSPNDQKSLGKEAKISESKNDLDIFTTDIL